MKHSLVLVLSFIFSLFSVKMEAQSCDDDYLIRSLKQTKVSAFPEVTEGANGSIIIKYPLNGVTYKAYDEATGVLYNGVLSTSGVTSGMVVIDVGAVSFPRTFVIKASFGSGCTVDVTDERTLAGQSKIVVTMMPRSVPTLTVRTEADWCRDSGGIHFEMIGQGVNPNDYHYYVRRSTDTSWGTAILHTNGVTALRAGTYVVRAVSKTDTSIEFSKSVTVKNADSEIKFGYSVLPSDDACRTTKNIQVNVTKGAYPLEFTLYDEAGVNVVRPRQASNVFKDVPAGKYRIEVNDRCAGDQGGNAEKMGAPLTITESDGLILTGDGWFSAGVRTDGDCAGEFMSLAFTVQSRGGNEFWRYYDAKKLPLPMRIRFTITAPDTQAAYQFDKTFTTHEELEQYVARDFSFRIPTNIPRQFGTWIGSVYITWCNGQKQINFNKTATVIEGQREQAFKSLRAETYVGGNCSERYGIRTSHVGLNIYAYAVLKSWPSCYKPEDGGFYKVAEFGDEYVKRIWLNHAALVPADASACVGPYRFEIVNDCGDVVTLTHTLTEVNAQPSGRWYNYYAITECTNFSTVADSYISDRFTLAFDGVRTLTITKAEEVGQPLPHGITLPYRVEQRFETWPYRIRIPNMPVGRYTVKSVDDCGVERELVLNVTEKEDYHVQWSKFECDSYITITQRNSRNGVRYQLERYDENDSEWKVFGSHYGAGTHNIGSVLGRFRINRIVAYDNVVVCNDVISEHTYDNKFNDFTLAYVSCDATNHYVKVIPKGGVPPYRYQIVRKNGTPFHVESSAESYMFNLRGSDSDIYDFQVTDKCGISTHNKQISIKQMEKLTIKAAPETVCLGREATISVQDLGGLSYAWFRADASNVTITTSTTLVIPSTQEADYQNDYILRYTAKDVVNACISGELRIRLKRPDTTTVLPTVTPAMSKEIVICADERVNDYNLRENLFPTLPAEGKIFYKYNDKEVTNSTSFNLSTLAVGSHRYEYVLTNECGDKVSLISTIVIKSNASASFSNLRVTLCAGEYPSGMTFAELEQKIRQQNNTANILKFYWYESHILATRKVHITDMSQQVLLPQPGVAHSHYYFRIYTDNDCPSGAVNIVVERIDSSPNFLIDFNQEVCENISVSELRSKIYAGSPSLIKIYRKTGTELTLLTDLYQLQNNETYVYRYEAGNCVSPEKKITLNIKQRTSVTDHRYENVCDETITVSSAIAKLKAEYPSAKENGIRIFDTNKTTDITNQPNRVLSFGTTYYFTVEEIEAMGHCPSTQAKIFFTEIPDSQRTPAPARSLSVCGNETIGDLKAKIGGANVVIYANGVEQADDVLVQGAVNYQYTIHNAGVNACYSKKAALSLQITPATIIRTQPVSANFCLNAQGTLSIDAVGENISYQWYSNDTATQTGAVTITTATSRILTINSVTTPKYYFVVVSGNCGKIVSDIVRVGINPVTTITTQPQGGDVYCQNASIANQLVVIAEGSNLKYQWYESTSNSSPGVAISGATRFYHRPDVSQAGKKYYYVVVTGDCGVRSSTYAEITVNPATAISQQPVGAVYCKNDVATPLKVTVSGNVTYKWYVTTRNNNTSGSPIAGAESATYTPITDTAGTYYYYVKVANNDCGTEIVSQPVQILVKETTSITTNLQDKIFCLNQSSPSPIISVAMQGHNLRYEWYVNTTRSLGGIRIPGAETNSYSVPTNNPGTKYYYVIVKGDCGEVTSAIARVDVNNALQITSQPQDKVLCQGSDTEVLTVRASDSDLKYQWYINNNNKDWAGASIISGATGATYTPLTTNAYIGKRYYMVRVTNACGTVRSSDIATVEVKPSFTFTAQPQRNTYCKDVLAQPLRVVISGATNPRYQWFENTSNNNTNGTRIDGATGATYTPSTATTGTKYYYVEVTDNCGKIPSNVVDIQVRIPATLVEQTVTNDLVCNNDNPVIRIRLSEGNNYLGMVYWNTTGDTNTNTSTYQTRWQYWANEYAFNVGGATTDRYYFVELTDPCGAKIVTTPIKIKRRTQTRIVTQPQTVDVCQGQTPTPLAVVAEGENLRYQWYYGDVPISGATSATYTPGNQPVGSNYSLSHRVRITGDCGEAWSNYVNVNIKRPITITTQPQAHISQCNNSGVSISVGVTGDHNGSGYFYQWYENTTSDTTTGTKITGATHNSYSVPTPLQSKYYYVVVTGLCSVQTSTVTRLEAKVPARIVSQTVPTGDVYYCKGETAATMSVTVEGTNVRYQWEKYINSWLDIPGETGSSYTPSTNEVAYYRLRIITDCNTIHSNQMRVMLRDVTTITSQPSNVSACSNQNARVQVSVAGQGPHTYQWYRNTTDDTTTGTKINNANNYYYDVPGTNPEAYYYVVVKGLCNTVTSTAAKVTPMQLTRRVSQPTSITYCYDAVATPYKVVAEGTNLTYQWYKHIRGTDSAIANATTDTYTPSTTESAGYRVYVKGSCGEFWTDWAWVTIQEKPKITSIPATLNVCRNGQVTIDPVYNGTDVKQPVTYQWYSNDTNDTTTGTKVNGQITSRYTITNASESKYYYVVATNECGSVTSTATFVKIVEPITIKVAPTHVYVCENGTVTTPFTVSATGDILRYEWYRNDVLIPGENTNIYTPTNTNENAIRYRVKIVSVGGCNDGWSDYWGSQLYVQKSASITVQPVSQEICNGGWVRVQVTAIGDELEYQWYRNTTNDTNTGTPVSGQTNWNYDFNINSTNEGWYYVKVRSKRCGTWMTSTAAHIKVKDNHIVTEPVGAEYCEGDAIQPLKVEAVGTNLKYQWYENGYLKAGATGAVYTPTVPAGSNYRYFVNITGSDCNAYNSKDVYIRVYRKSTITRQPTAQVRVCKNAGSPYLEVGQANGENPISVQWYENTVNDTTTGVPVAGGNNWGYNAPTNVAGTRYYYAVITSRCNVVTSTTSRIIVDEPISFITQPSGNATYCQNDANVIPLSATATGTNVTYQWYRKRNGSTTLINGATSSVYTPTTDIQGVTTYFVRINSTGTACGNQTLNSNEVTITVTPKITITTQPQGASYCKGDIASAMNVVANGTVSLYKWFRNDTATTTGAVKVFESSTSNAFTPPTDVEGEFYYYASLESVCQDEISNFVKVTIKSQMRAVTTPSVSVCVGRPMAPIVIQTENGVTSIGTILGLPSGVNASFANDEITISGMPQNSGIYNFQIELRGGCGNVAATGTINVTSAMSVLPLNNSFSICAGTPITIESHRVAGAISLGTISLPAGLTATLVDEKVTISGSTTAVVGTYPFEIEVLNACSSVSVTGNIEVVPAMTVSAASQTPTVCLNTPITAIEHTTSGITFVGTPSNLPNGLTVNFAANKLIISGTPTQPGTWNYEIPLSGNCGIATAKGRIVVEAPDADVTITAPGCATSGSAKIANYDATLYRYTLLPAGSTIAANGVINVGTANYGKTHTLTVEALSGNQCSITTTFVVNDKMPAPKVVTNATCAPTAKAQIQNYDNSVYDYQITPSGTINLATGEITDLLSGSYVVRATHKGGGCHSETTFTAVAGLVSTATVSITQNCSATAKATIAGYNPNMFVYSITPVGTQILPTGEITNVVAETNYQLYVADKNGISCGGTIPFVVHNQLIKPNVSVGNATCASAGTATLTNYDNNLEYIVSDGGYVRFSGALQLNGLTDGATVTYTITARKKNNAGVIVCEEVTEFVVKGRTPVQPAIISETASATCSDWSKVRITNYDTTTYNYKFINANTLSDITGQLVVDNTGAIDHTAISQLQAIKVIVEVSTKSGVSCSSSSTYTLTPPAVRSITPLAMVIKSPTCFQDGEVRLESIGNYNRANIGFEVPVGATTPSIDATSGLISNVSFGETYTITYFVLAANGASCQTSTTFKVEKLLRPELPIIRVKEASCLANGTASVTNYNPALYDYEFSPAGPTINPATKEIENISFGAFGATYQLIAKSKVDANCQMSTFFNVQKKTDIETPQVTTSEPTCYADGKARLSNYKPTEYTYTISPAGATINTNGEIENMAFGTVYIVEATRIGTACSATSSGFSVLGRVSVDAPVFTTVPATCDADGAVYMTNYTNTLTYTFIPTGVTIDPATKKLIGVRPNTPYSVQAQRVANGIACQSALVGFEMQGKLPAVATPTIAVVSPTCSTEGSAIVTNYNSSAEYVLSPSTPGTYVDFTGKIVGLQFGTSYQLLVKAVGGACTTTSKVFIVLDKPSAVETPVVSVVSPTCTVAGSAKLTNLRAGYTYSLVPAGANIDNVTGNITGIVYGTQYTLIAQKTENGVTCSATTTFKVEDAISAVVPNVSVASATCDTIGKATVTNYNSAIYDYSVIPSGFVNSQGEVQGIVFGASYQVVATVKGSVCSATSTPFVVDNKIAVVSPILVEAVQETCTTPNQVLLTNYDTTTYDYRFIHNSVSGAVVTVDATSKVVSATHFGTYQVVVSPKANPTCVATATFTLYDAVENTFASPELIIIPARCNNPSEVILKQSHYVASGKATITPASAILLPSGAIYNTSVGTTYTITITEKTRFGQDCIKEISFTVDAPTLPEKPKVLYVDESCTANGKVFVQNYSPLYNYSLNPAGPSVNTITHEIENLVPGRSYELTATLKTDASCQNSLAGILVNRQISVEKPVIRLIPETCYQAGRAEIQNYDASVYTYTFSPVGPEIVAGVVTNVTYGVQYQVVAKQLLGSTCESQPVTFILNDKAGIEKPLVGVSSATCDTAGEARITNYDNRLSYRFFPPGPVVDASGNITNVSYGISYSLMAESSYASVPCQQYSDAFVVPAKLPQAAVNVEVTLPTCEQNGTAKIKDYNASFVYNFSPSNVQIDALGNVVSLTYGTVYTLTVQNGSCQTVTTFVVEEKPTAVQTPIVEKVIPTDCNSVGSVRIANFDDATYSYTITPAGALINPSNGMVTNLSQGVVYTLEVTNRFGAITCQKEVTFTAVDIAPVVSVTSATCDEVGVAKITNYTNTLTYHFVPSGPFVDASGEIKSVTYGVDYQLFMEIGGEVCSITSVTFNVPEVKFIEPIFETVSATCSDLSRVFITNYNPSYQYSFSSRGVTLETTSVTTTVEVKGLRPMITYLIRLKNNVTNCTGVWIPLPVIENRLFDAAEARPIVTRVSQPSCDYPEVFAIQNYNTLKYNYTFFEVVSGTTTSTNSISVKTSGEIENIPENKKYIVVATAKSGVCSVTSEEFIVRSKISPEKPVINTVSATCTTPMKASVANYDPVLNTYIFNPTGPSIQPNGEIVNAVYGVKYILEANTKFGNCRAFSDEFIIEPTIKVATPTVATITQTICATDASATYSFAGLVSTTVSHTVVWYETLTATTALSVAPEIDTNVATTTTFTRFVSQISSENGCEGARVPVSVKVMVCKIDANDDRYIFTGSHQIVGNILTNDTLAGTKSATIDNVTISIVSTPSGIIPQLNTTDGNVIVPANIPNGTYTIVYEICEKASGMNCDTATVTVVVSRAVPPITAVDDVADVVSNKAVTIPVLNNDKNIPDFGTITPIVAPKNGTVVVNNNGTPDLTDDTITYTPDVDFEGVDTFVYEVCDTYGNCASATVTVDVSSEIVPYNGMSVDGDGVNETFHIKNIELYPNNTVRIFNRWGVKVYEATGYDNTTVAFKGLSSGRTTIKYLERLPQGTYYYVIEYTDKKGKSRTKTGYLYVKPSGFAH